MSTLLFLGKIIEAFADTLIGYWSDRTTSRLGRRLPFVILAAPPAALFAILLFFPPVGSSGELAAAWLFIALELFYLCDSLAGVPFSALLPEIAESDGERLSLAAWQVYFGVIGAAIGLIGSGLLINRFGFRAMIVVMALLALASRYAGVVGVWNRTRRDTPPAPRSLVFSLRQTLSNHRFLWFMLSFVLFSTALAMLIGLLPYFVSSLLDKSSAGTWSSILTAVGIGSMALALPVFAWLAHRTSQLRAYRYAMLAAAVAFPILCVVGWIPGISRDLQALIALVIVGAPLAGVYLFPGPIIANFCDVDALSSGMRREGMFYSTQAFLDQVTEAFAPLLLGLLLLLGDTPRRLIGIRLVGPVAGLLVLIGYLVLRSPGD